MNTGSTVTPNSGGRTGVTSLPATNVAAKLAYTMEGTDGSLPSGGDQVKGFGSAGSGTGNSGGLYELKVIASLMHTVGKFSLEMSADSICITSV